MSHPMWVRGLKHALFGFSLQGGKVAPYVGAWIETSVAQRTPYFLTSHPMWVRGLKQERGLVVFQSRPSHPMWVRGLKRQYRAANPAAVQSHPMWVRGLKHVEQCTKKASALGRTLCGCVD